MKDIRSLIHEILKKQELLSRTIVNSRLNFEEFSDADNFLLHVSSEQLNSSEIINLIADNLQLLESKELIEQFDLEDILTLYQLTLANNQYNLEFFEDYILFKINVLDQAADATRELDEYINLIGAKVDELKDILQSLKSE